LAQSGHGGRGNECLLLGVKRTSHEPQRCPLLIQNVIGLSHSVDARGVTPRRGEMDVQVVCFLIRELALYRGFDVSAFDDLQPLIIPAASKPRTASVRLRSCSGTSPMKLVCEHHDSHVLNRYAKTCAAQRAEQ
jgi:hypothetical protein